MNSRTLQYGGLVLIGNTSVLQVEVSGSNPLRSTIFVSRWCNGSIRVSKTLGGSSSLSRDANNLFPGGVMVTQLTLTQSFLVRAQAGVPNNLPP